MKLIGSLTETKFRKELLASSLAWQREARIIQLLETHILQVDTILSLGWTPDQLEDWHTILVNGQHVVCLEVPKGSGAPHVASVESTAVYARRLKGAMARIQLAVALELSRELSRAPEGSSGAITVPAIDDF
ncbi:hypothetical protein ABE473_01515 [Stenotrophomonas sp. TWI700]|uniref:hypothetical protein n=1 Tax=Stenotrophomonas sp. TWI700 TaxID=3136792 RepID=UPI00320A516C